MQAPPHITPQKTGSAPHPRRYGLCELAISANSPCSFMVSPGVLQGLLYHDFRTHLDTTPYHAILVLDPCGFGSVYPTPPPSMRKAKEKMLLESEPEVEAVLLLDVDLLCGGC